MANSDFSLTDMDMSVCMIDQGRVSLMHYYVKQEILPPYPHSGVSRCAQLITLFLFAQFFSHTLPYRVYDDTHAEPNHNNNSGVASGGNHNFSPPPSESMFLIKVALAACTDVQSLCPFVVHNKL